VSWQGGGIMRHLGANKHQPASQVLKVFAQMAAESRGHNTPNAAQCMLAATPAPPAMLTHIMHQGPPLCCRSRGTTNRIQYQLQALLNKLSGMCGNHALATTTFTTTTIRMRLWRQWRRHG
jgi:hypothetical protein